MFGQSNNKSIFGQTNTTNAFGTNTGFGLQSSASTGPFGAMTASQPAQQSIFGSQPNQALFGSTQTSIFGSNPSTSNANTFGAQNTTNAFGGTTSSIFGGNQQNSSIFGANRFGTTSTTSPFGSNSMTQTMAAPNGTTIKFVATAGTDTMMKNGNSTNINTRHQCITCMREYEMKSLEELRLEDYVANRKGPQQSSVFGANTGTTSNIFGANTQPQTAFGSTSSTGLFNQNKPTFGNLAQTTTTTTSSGLFGNLANKPLFGNTNTFSSTPSQSPATSIFGSVSASNPSLNQPFFSSNTTNNTAAVKPLFGSTTSQPQQPLFGQTNAQNSSIGQKPMFGNTTTPAFGQNTNSLFSSGTTSNLFSSSQPSLFSTGSTATNNTMSKPLFNFNSQPSLSLNQPLGGTAVTSTPSLFGNTSNTFSNTNSMFGPTSSAFNFGPTNTSFQTNSFQPSIGLQQMATPSLPVSNDQLVTRFQTFPYGDAPQLHVDVTNSPNTGIKTKFTTDPKTLNQYKISGKTIDSKPQRIAINAGKATAMLFDGLEEDNYDENKTAKDIFVPRKNIKKLVFKQKNTSLSDLDESQTPSNSFIVKQHEGIKFDNSIASDVTVNEFINSDNRFIKQTNTTNRERLTISPAEKGDISITSPSIRTDPELNETIAQLIAPKCGLILTRTDYYTIPTIEELDKCYDVSSESCIVDSFTVGRHDYGSVYWDGPIDVKGLNIDDIVHIRRKEVIVYPDEELAPKVGEGLNRAAQISLHQVWPIDKATHEVIKDKERLKSMKYSEKIETATLKLGANFKEYRPDTGSWVFTVKHFSKYGLQEDDEEEDIEAEQQSKEVVNQVISRKDTAVVKKSLFSQEIDQNKALDSDLNMNINQEVVKPKDNTMNFLLNQNESEQLFVEDSHTFSPQLKSPYNEYDKMRSTLFDDYESEAVTKKSKSHPIIVSQNEINPKSNYYFSPIVSSVVKPVIPKKRNITFEADIYSAQNKIICDISSVCVSKSPKISFFNGSNRFTIIKGNTVLVCELNLINVDNSADERFTEQLKDNSEIIVPNKSSDKTIAPFIKTKEFCKNSKNPLALELLVDALYGHLSEVTPYASYQERMDRIQVWLFSVNKKLPMPKQSYLKIMHFLSTNELEAAVDEAIASNNPRLALLLSSGNSINKDLMIAQLDSWKRSKADNYIDNDLIRIYILLSGQISWKTSNGIDVNILDKLNWTQQLALILLYRSLPEVQDNELGINVLSESISKLTVEPDQVEYHLLASHTPWKAMSYSSDILESWFLHQSLKCYRVINDDNDLNMSSDAVHALLASQLKDIRWSCFVATHIRHDSVRENTIKDILGRNSLLLENNDVVEWLLNNISMPKEYIAEAKAIKSKSVFDYNKLAVNLIDCQQFTEAHDVLIDYVFPDMIINEEHESLSEMIRKLKPHSHQISSWFPSGGHIYETYLNCLESSDISSIKAFNIHQLKCKAKRHVLCQSEMARKVNIIYSELSGGTYAYNTPIPDDYALIELKINAKNMIQLLF